MPGTRAIVDPPPFTPTPYGLLTTVDWQPNGDLRWEAGITYQQMCDKNGVNGQLGASTYPADFAVTGVGGAAPAPPNLASTTTSGRRGATPFIAYAEFDCAPVGNADAVQKAQQALAMSESWQAEQAFYRGVTGGQVTAFPHLASNAVILDPVDSTITLQTAVQTVTGVAGDSFNVVTALGLLEGALANCYNGVGVIHVPELALPSLDAWGLVKANGPVMRTLNGNKVAVGAGYPGSGPDGTVRGANQVWLYATGNVFGFRSEVRVRSQGPQAFDRATNTQKMIAERTYVLAWDCCHFAIQAQLGTPKGT